MLNCEAITLSRMAEPSEFRKCSTQDDKCPKHGIERSLFCKGDGCQRNVCPVCLMKDHSYHDVIAPENGFVYCSDICTVEMLNVMMTDMAISTRGENQRPDVGARSTETNPGEKLSPNNGEIVYNRKDEAVKGSKETFSFTKMVQTKGRHEAFFHVKVVTVQSVNIVLFQKLILSNLDLLIETAVLYSQ